MEQELEDNKLFDLLDKLPDIRPGRNDQCLCGSGKKYKKCCIEKDRSLTPRKIRTETVCIKSDPLTRDEAKNNFPDLTGKDEKILTNIYHTLLEYPDTIDSEDNDYFRQLHLLRAKHPDNPTILNFLINGYKILGMEQKVEDLIQEAFEKFPGYLFAQTDKANLYLDNGDTEKAIEVLKGSYSLKQLYPERDVFHVSEVRALEDVLVRYYCMKQEVKQAEIHLGIMEKVFEEDDPLLQSAKDMVRKTSGLCKLKNGLLRFIRSKK